ncbi:XRE family transcriptional regulator [Nocardia transvalensis]|uniref:XRE family transcriptional regulator n=1 Tax=Nocardia transvalensis TaxID=37333 RepID=UPI0018940D22|nr:XRE family transcriptional regulator [Nocardia transvalensis]MBF6327298.1 XRE family transcriptional regulator [Nocardia transvalensis]
MVLGRPWTGFEAVALQEATRKSVREFAAHLGVEMTTVANWRSGLSAVTPRPLTQELLDTLLVQVSADVRERFEQILAEGEQALGSRRLPARRAGLPSAPSMGHEAALLARLDETRALVDRTLAACTVGPAMVELMEERTAGRVLTYTRTAPSAVLATLLPDVLEVQSISAQRQPAAIQARLSEVTAVLGLLVADALMKLGQIERANFWYGTARMAADDTGNRRLRARVRAQHAMLPYYYGSPEQAVVLARAAQAQLPELADDATALAAAAEARALARLGDSDGAELAMARARSRADELGETTTDEAFRFSEKRLLLYQSGTLTNLGRTAQARRVQEQALQLYRGSPGVVVDPALIELDIAVGYAREGAVDEACELAVRVLTRLPAEHRTTIVVTRAAAVVDAIPEGSRGRRAVDELRQLVAAGAGEPR